MPHLRTTLFISFAFVVAWSWDLVVYSASHVWNGEDPLDHELAFGNQHAPKYLFVLLAQYLVVCGAAALLSNRIRRKCRGGYRQAAVMAIEFFPSPVFAGKLMAYLMQFQLSPLQQAFLNLAATWFAAFLAQLAVPVEPGDGANFTMDPSSSIGFWQRTGLIIRDTLGFGLGIAWNALFGDFAPNQHSRMDFLHLAALVCYLLMVLILALKLAAMVPKQPVTIWERQLSLLAFAMYVVCGFTLVGFLNTVLGDGWIHSLACFGIVLVLTAVMSTMVALADLDGILENADGRDEENNMSSREYRSSKFRPCGGILNICIFIPCVWCCCPWIPVMILLAGMTESVNVKEHWFRLIAMVAGLSCSIEGSSILTTTANSLATTIGICGRSHCYDRWMFVLLQLGLAIICTIIVLPLIAPLASSPPGDDGGEAISPAGPSQAAVSAPSEYDPLLVLSPPPPALNPEYDPSRM